MGFTLKFLVHSISPEPLERFSLTFTQMILSVRQCVLHISRLRRLKVKVTLQGHVIYLSIRVRSISPEPFERFSLIFIQMFLSMRQCAVEPIIWLGRLNVKVTLQVHVIYSSIRVRSVNPETFGRYSFNFTQMFLSVRRCAVHMIQLPRLKVKLTCQGHGIYP